MACGEPQVAAPTMVLGHFWTVLPPTPTPKHDDKNVLESVSLSDVFSSTPFILISTAA